MGLLLGLAACTPQEAPPSSETEAADQPTQIAGQNPRDGMAEAFRYFDVMVALQEAFKADANATVPVADFDLPERMNGLDADGDGKVVQAELMAFETSNLRPYAGPQDYSGMSGEMEGGFPLNVDPEIIAASDAELGDEDMVMGVMVAGEARAYPVNYMNGPLNEVVNDTLGGAHITPTW